jgi:arginase family enzyme
MRGSLYAASDLDEPRSPAFVGCDVVEVSPRFDGPGHVTAVNAATVAYELVALTAVARSRR